MLIFLDFDGVLHPTPCYQESALCRLNILEPVLREFPQIEIVISSSWRDHYSLFELRDMFSDDIGTRIIGITPSIKTTPPGWMPPGSEAYERQYEIESWLKSNRPGVKWIALDDQPHLYKEGCQSLLITNHVTGFCPTDQDKLRAMIRERL